MAFYDMYPMGSGYGGMNVGGMPIGGVFPKQGDPLYAAFRQKVTAGRQAKSTWVQNKRAELAANGVSKKRAVQLSNQMWEAHKASLPGAKKHKTLADMTPDELATHKAKIVENRMARQQPGYVRVPHPTNKFGNVRRRQDSGRQSRRPVPAKPARQGQRNGTALPRQTLTWTGSADGLKFKEILRLMANFFD